MVKPMAMSKPEHDFFLGKALLHGLVAMIVFVALGMAFAGAGAFGGDTEKLAEAAGKQSGWAFLLALVASYGYQTGKRLLGNLMLFLVAVLFVFQLYTFVHVAQSRTDVDAPLTAAEKQRPALAGSGGRLCQPVLALSFPAPGGGFAASEALERQLDPKLLGVNLAQWVWEDSSTGERLIVQAARGAGRDERTFRAFAAGVKKGIAKNPNASILEEDLRWSEGYGELNLSYFLGATQLNTRCLGRGPEDEAPSIAACVQTVTSNGKALRQVRTGFSLGPCVAGVR
jgi:hypothetical protein